MRRRSAISGCGIINPCWKCRRAARKFEVYMRDHDRKVTFDEHGNYVPPDDNEKTNGGGKVGLGELGIFHRDAEMFWSKNQRP